jgi:hypothetical protein
MWIIPPQKWFLVLWMLRLRAHFVFLAIEYKIRPKAQYLFKEYYNIIFEE